MTSAQIDTIQALENENKILADEVKMKEDLIPGMEKMIAYLQKIQEENKRLKEEWVDPATVVQWEQAQVWLEENKRLRKCNETYEDLLAGEKGLIDKNEELKEEINLTNTALDMVKDENEVNKKNLMKAMEENKKLKNDLRLCAEGLIPHDLIQRGIVETCREKVKQLEEENKKLKRKYELSLEQTDKLEEENKNLNKYLAEVNIHLSFEEDMKELREENKKLKKEMKEYKDYYDKWSQIIPSIDGDAFCDLLQECGWEENDEGELVRVTDK